MKIHPFPGRYYQRKFFLNGTVLSKKQKNNALDRKITHDQKLMHTAYNSSDYWPCISLTITAKLIHTAYKSSDYWPCVSLTITAKLI